MNRTTVLLSLGAVILLSWCLRDYVVLLVEFLAGREGCRFDDAYMFVRYADQLRDGHGLVWNRGAPPTYGATSLLYLFAVALARTLSTLPMELLISVVSALFGLLALLVLVGAGCALARPPSRLRTLWLAAWVVPAVLLAAPFRYHLLTGMDTTLALATNALLVWALAVLIHRPRRATYLLVAGAAYLTYLARPDNGLYALLCPTLAILLLLPRAERRAALLTVGPVLIGLLVLDGLIKTWQFGAPLPLGHYVKQTGFYEGYASPQVWNPVAYLQTFLRAALPFLVVLVLGAGRRHLRWLVVCLLPVAITFVYYFRITQIMGYEARLYYPALPFLAVPAAAVLDQVIGRLARPRAWLLRGGAVLLLGAGILAALPALADWYGASVLAPRFDAQRYPQVRSPREVPPLGLWRSRIQLAGIARRLPPGTVVAASEVGYLGAQAPHVAILDLAGLNDRRIAREGVTLATLLGRGVDLIWMPHTDYRPIHRGILTDPAFRERFDYLPGAYNFGLAIRRDSPHYRAVMSAVHASWRRSYGVPLERFLISARPARGSGRPSQAGGGEGPEEAR